MELVRPGSAHLASYVAALERGWSPDNERGVVVAEEQLAQIAADAPGFLAALENREGVGTVTLPDGSAVPRLPGFVRWMWDGEFCGSISLRWQAGTTALPPYCLGHIGYGVVPWKRRRGHASAALAMILAQAREFLPGLGLRFVELTTDLDNVGSQTVIAANGGVLHEHFVKPAQFRNRPGLRFRVALTGPETQAPAA